MNSELTLRARRGLELLAGRFLAVPDTTYLDELVDRAIESEWGNASCPASHDAFNRMLTRFVTDAYAAWPSGERLPPKVALAKAMELLRSHFAVGDERGYDAAIAQITVGEEEQCRDVLACLANALGEELSSGYRTWALASLVDPNDWELKCEIVRQILHTYRDVLPESLTGIAPTRFANHIPALLQVCLEPDQVLQNYLQTTSLR